MVAAWENFLADHQGAPGIVIDLRGNGGGNAELLYTMASYFFADTAPARWAWLDTYSYDAETGGLVKGFTPDVPLFSPKAELRYDGAIVVLVDDKTASAGEYFPQFLQRHGRAIVVGQHGTEGAGGPVEQVRLPGNITFYFTKGRTYFAGTDELNLEAKGVSLDVRVPVTLDSIASEQVGGDPVLDAAVAALQAEVGNRALARLTGTKWRIARVMSAPGGPADPRLGEQFTIAFEAGGGMSIGTDCNSFKASFAIGEGQSLSISPTLSTMMACPPGSRAEDFMAWLTAAESLQFDSTEMLILTGTNSGVMGLMFQSVP
jgi:heat shock protein HslJ